MGINHLEPAYTDEAAATIQEYGGKLGGLKFLETKEGFNDYLLPMKVVRPGEIWNQTPGMVDNIVRASHPHDFQGLVNVVQSEKINVRRQSVEDTIERIRSHARSEQVMAYAQYENPAYDGNVVVCVQSLMDGKTMRTDKYRRGSVVEHPNRPGTYLAEWVDEFEDFMGGDQSVLTSALYNDDGERVQSFFAMREPPKNAASLIALYKKIRGANLVRDDYTFQMEFGEVPDVFQFVYQVRALMKKATADFTVDQDDATSNVVFGITPAQGVELPVYVEDRGYVASPEEPFAILTPRPRDRRNLSFRPKNVAAYLAGTMYGRSALPNMQHGNFWKAQKADVTLFERHEFESLVDEGSDLRRPQEGVQEAKIRVISDGIHAIAKKIA